MILTLKSTAERLGCSCGEHAMNQIRRLEKASGRTILIVRGEGRARRYMVLEQQLDAALEGDFKKHVDAVAETIRKHMESIDTRFTNHSERISALEAEPHRTTLTRV